MIAQFLLGATSLGWGVAALVFLRFWRRTRDRFFLLFAFSFWLEALLRVVLAAFPEQSEDNPVFYIGRVIGYGLILLAIWQKNKPKR